MLMQIFRSSKRPRELREDAGTSISIAEFQTLVSMQTLFVIVVSMICFCVLTEPGVTKSHQLSTEMRALSTQMSAHEDKTTATVQHILEKLDTVTTYVQSHALQIFHISTGTSDICDMQKVISSQYSAACLKMQMTSNNTFFVLTICVAL